MTVQYKYIFYSKYKQICIKYVNIVRYALYVNKSGNNRLSEKLLFSVTGKKIVSLQFGLFSHLLL